MTGVVNRVVSHIVNHVVNCVVNCVVKKVLENIQIWAGRLVFCGTPNLPATVGAVRE